MKSKTKRILALLCAVVMVATTFFGNWYTKQAEAETSSEEAQQPDQSFNKITFIDFGIDDNTYNYNGDVVVEGSTSETLNKTVFSGDILLSGSKGFQIMYGGKANTWDGLRIALQDDGNMNLLWTKIGVSDLFIKQITPANVGMTEFVNHTFNLTISTELVDADGNGVDDIKIGVWFNNVLYQNDYIIVTDRGEELGNRFGVYCGMEGSSVTLKNNYWLPQWDITFSNFGIDNNTYNYNGDVVVEGSTSEALNKTVFSGDILLSGSKGFQIMYGGKANTWDGLRIALQDDGNMNLLWTKIGVSDLFIKQITPANVGMTEFVNRKFNLTISTELVDADGNGVDDIKIGVWFNNVLYQNDYIIVTDRGEELGNRFGVYCGMEGSSVTLGSMQKAAEEPEDPETPPEQPNENFEKITFHDFGVDSGKYKYNGDVVVLGSTKEYPTLNQLVFSGDVLLSGEGSYQLMFGGKASEWNGLRLITQDNGAINAAWYKGDDAAGTIQIAPSDVGLTSFYKQKFNIMISMELVDENENGTEDIKIGVWLNKVLYKNEYMIISDRGEELGNKFGIFCGTAGTSVTLGSVPELPKQSFDKITFSQFGVPNGTYEYNRDVVVSGSTNADEYPTLNQLVFSGDVYLSGEGSYHLMFGGKDSEWNGLRLITQDNGAINAEWYKGNDATGTIQIAPSDVGLTSFYKQKFNIMISMELVDENENGTDDIKIGVWLNKVLYKNEYMIISDRGNELGNKFGIFCGTAGTSVTLGSIPELTTQPDEAYEKVTFSQFGIKDDTYKYLGDRDSVVVKGSIAGTEGVDKKVVCGKVLFEGSGEFQLLLGGTHAWDGLHLYVNADYSATTMILLGLDSQEVTSFDAGKAGLTSFVGGDGFELMWSVEEVGTDLKVGVWFNGFLYGNEYITISNCNPDLGNIFAVACSADGASVTLGSMSELTKLPEHSLNKVTFSDFGIESGTYEGSKEVAGNADKYTTLDGAVFSGDFFVSEGKQFYVLYGGKDGSYWNSLSFMIQDGGEMNVAWYTNGTATDLIQILPENTAAGTFLNKTFNLMISAELVDNDGNGVDDIKVRIWFDKILYKHNGGEYHIISDMGDALGNGLGMYCGSGVTVSIREDAEYQEDIYYYDDISPYRTTGAYEGPVKEGLVFSGWYEDKDYTKPIGQDVTQGGAYAKFVEGDVLSVKPQVKVTNTGELPMDKTDLRFATTVDSLEYRRVSFFIQTQKGDGQNYGAETDTGINENPENPREVYRQLYYMNNTKISKYVPSVFSWMSNFFKTVTLTNIPYANYGTMIKVTPYWITLDGTTVRGTALEICVNQYERTTTEGLYKVTTEFLGENTMPIAGYHGPYQYNGADNNGLFPNYVTDEYFKMIADAGVNLVVHSATDYAEYPSLVMKQLELGEKYGIGMYVNDSNICNLTSTDAIKTYIQNAKYFNSKAFCGMFVADEPGGTDNVSGERNIADIGDELSALKSLGLLDYTNMYPIQNYITSGTLETWFTPNAINDKDKNIYNTYVNTVSKLDTSVLSWDYYPFEEKRLTTNGTYDMNLYFWNLNLIREKAIANNKPFWAHIQAGSQFNNKGEDFPSTTPYYPSESQFNWNVNTNLAFGAKGIQYFPLIQPDGFAYVDSSTWDFERNGLIGAYGNKTQWYYYAQEINKHIAEIDEVLMNSVNKGVIVSGSDAQSDTKNLNTYGADSTCIINSYKELTSVSGNAMVGCFDYNGKMALYVVNYNMCDQNAAQDEINAAKQTITLGFNNDYSNIKMIQNATSSVQTTNNKQLNLTLEAGEGVLLVIE